MLLAQQSRPMKGGKGVVEQVVIVYQLDGEIGKACSGGRDHQIGRRHQIIAADNQGGRGRQGDRRYR